MLRIYLYMLFWTQIKPISSMGILEKKSQNTSKKLFVPEKISFITI